MFRNCNALTKSKQVTLNCPNRMVIRFLHTKLRQRRCSNTSFWFFHCHTLCNWIHYANMNCSTFENNRQCFHFYVYSYVSTMHTIIVRCLCVYEFYDIIIDRNGMCARVCYITLQIEANMSKKVHLAVLCTLYMNQGKWTILDSGCRIHCMFILAQFYLC